MSTVPQSWTEPGVYEAAPGVHRIPLPLPNDGLRAVNVYAVEDGDGLILIDSGWALEEARTQLESALGSLGYGFEDIRRFLVTHVHRDHYTMAVTLRRMYGAKVALGIGEQPSLNRIITGQEVDQLAELISWGAEPMLERLAEMYAGIDRRQAQRAYERPDDWLTGETDIDLDKRVLRALPTPGHTQGHVVFLDPESSLLFAGDHVLPHITPSIGFEPVRAKLPLGDYLDSLRLLRNYPDMRLLPAHGPVAPSVHGRVTELLRHHDERLAATLETIRDGAGTAYESARRLGWTRRHRHFDELDVFNQLLAVGETSAHLELLVVRAELRSTATEGVTEYALPPAETN
jgi:glyoxylase-like metal-dependent hydrolase (beta-lactamase superfamily II)